MIELSWTRDQVLDQIDVPFLDCLNASWASFPPLRRMVAAYLGIKPRDKPRVALPNASPYQSKEDHSAKIDELLAMFPGGQIR